LLSCLCLHERRAHRLDLLSHLGAHIEGPDLGAKACGSAQRGQSRDARTNHEHLRRRSLAGGRHLAGEHAAEVFGGLNDGTVSGDVRHRGQHVHGLCAGDAGHCVERHPGDAALGEVRNVVGTGGCIHHRDEYGALAHFGELRCSGRVHRRHDVGLPGGTLGADRGARGRVVLIRERRF